MSNPNPMRSRCGLEDCDCGHAIEKLQNDLNVMTDLATLRLRGTINDTRRITKLVKLVREFAAHPCVNCDGCSTEAERHLNEPY